MREKVKCEFNRECGSYPNHNDRTVYMENKVDYFNTVVFNGLGYTWNYTIRCVVSLHIDHTGILSHTFQKNN